MKKILFTVAMFLISSIALAQYRISTEGISKQFSIEDIVTGKTYNYPREYVTAEINELGNIVILLKEGSSDGRPFAFSRYTSIPFTEFRDGNNADATLADNQSVIDWFYDNTGFKTAPGGSGVTTETIALTGGNQTISITDADKVIGFTLISSSTSIDITSGYLSGTWMINDNRNVIRCFIQTLEQPFIKMIMASVKIDNALNEIQITNKTARYWDITGTQPQVSLSTNEAPYTLGSIVLIKKLN